MIRPVSDSDTESIIALTAGTGFFKPLELTALEEVLHDYHESNHEHEHRAIAWEEQGELLGYMYYAPAPMTDRSWYLYWLAVATGQQGRGLGGKLLAFVEADIRAAKGRFLFIETSATDHYAPTRQFYLKHDYQLVASIADFYADGDGLAVFAKRISPKESASVR